jgi:hypothetical protein
MSSPSGVAGIGEPIAAAAWCAIAAARRSKYSSNVAVASSDAQMLHAAPRPVVVAIPTRKGFRG